MLEEFSGTYPYDQLLISTGTRPQTLISRVLKNTLFIFGHLKMHCALSAILLTLLLKPLTKKIKVRKDAHFVVAGGGFTELVVGELLEWLQTV